MEAEELSRPGYGNKWDGSLTIPRPPSITGLSCSRTLNDSISHSRIKSLEREVTPDLCSYKARAKRHSVYKNSETLKKRLSCSGDRLSQYVNNCKENDQTLAKGSLIRTLSTIKRGHSIDSNENQSKLNVTDILRAHIINLEF